MGAIFDNKVSEVIFTLVETEIQFAPVVSSIVIQNETGESQDSPDSNMSGSNESCEIQAGSEEGPSLINEIKDNQDPVCMDHGKKKKGKIIQVFDSDESENELVTNSITSSHMQNNEEEDNPNRSSNRFLDSDESETETQNKSKRSYRVESYDSDLESDDHNQETNTLKKGIAVEKIPNETIKVNSLGRNEKSDKTNSDSKVVSENNVRVSNVQEKNNLVDNKKTVFQTCSDSDDESVNNFKKSKISDIVDSESSEDETPVVDNTSNETKNGSVERKLQNSRKKMTGKEALEQRREIKSESQRMLRESRVSIPYHKPKSRTIKEFFKNRPRISDPIPDSVKSLSPSMAIKVTTNQLKVLSERLQEREKIMKEFYKSESDSESENTNNAEMETVENNDKHLDIDMEQNQNESIQNKENIFVTVDNKNRKPSNATTLDISKEINELEDLEKELIAEKNIICSKSHLSVLSEQKISINETKTNELGNDIVATEDQSLIFEQNMILVPRPSQIETLLEKPELEKSIGSVGTDDFKENEIVKGNLSSSRSENDIRKSSSIQITRQTIDVSRKPDVNKKDTKCDRTILNNISISFKELLDSMDSNITMSQLKEELLKSFLRPSNLEKRKTSTLYDSLQESQVDLLVDDNLTGSKYSNSVGELRNKSSSINYDVKTSNVSAENITEIDESTDIVNNLFNSSNNDLKLVQESIETLDKIPNKMCESNDKQNKILNQSIGCNLNSLDYQNESDSNSKLLPKDIPKLTNSQIDNLKECEAENEKKSMWSDLSVFNELDSDDENDSGKINRLKTNPYKPQKNDMKHPSVEYVQPKLTGGPDLIIDLDEDVNKPKGMNTLLKRYMNHITKKQTEERKLELKVISAEGGQIHEDKVAVPVSKVDDTGAGANFEKPGVKLMRLKGDLRQQIMQKRSEEWAKKEHELRVLRGEDDELEDEDDVYEGEKQDCCDDQSNTKEMNDEDNDSEDIDEEECVEDDIEMTDELRQTKSAFVDEEAEEDEDEKDFEDDEENEDSEEENEVEENEDSDESEKYERDCEKNDQRTTKAERGVKRLRRIKAAFEDDSDSDTEIEKMKKAAEEAIDRAIDCTDTPKKTGDISSDDIDVFDTNNCGCEDEIPAHQRVMQCTPVASNSSKSLTVFQSKSESDFISPVLKLTALQGMSSVTKHNSESPEISQFFSSSESSSLRDVKSAKRLFSDLEPENSQENFDELMDLCSGKFTTQNCVVPAKESKMESFTQHSQWLNDSPATVNNKKEKSLSNQRDDDELKSVLVGGLSLSADGISIDKDDNDEISNSSQNFKLIWLEESDNELKDLENICSKKTVQTPLPSKDIDIFKIVSSAEEDNLAEMVKRNKKFTKKKIKLKFSDDEHSDSENESIQMENSDEGIEYDNDMEDDDAEVDYDSEENEVVSKKTKATDFFEKEAELSESDWDSADEDEKDLDEFEREEGDDDNLDQKKVRNELERIHMRHVLDDDQREVRMLQEILLEDGELHSESGRKRQFKWRNIDDVGVDENAPPEDDADTIVYDEEEDTEEHWRRMRHEREKFLEEKRAKLLRNNDSQDLLDLELEEDDSQIMKLGQAALRRSINTSHIKTNIISNGVTVCHTETVSKSVTIKSGVIPNITDIKKPFTLVNKRGSFLARGENALARLAAITKDSSEMQVNTLKNTRNFVFTTVDPAEKLQSTVEVVEKQTAINKGKRKASIDGTPSILKKLKVADALVRSNSNTRVKKLFDAM